jgi:hypothetical protein
MCWGTITTSACISLASVAVVHRRQQAEPNLALKQCQSRALSDAPAFDPDDMASVQRTVEFLHDRYVRLILGESHACFLGPLYRGEACT